MALTPTEEIKGKLDIAEFVGSYVKLYKAGKNYKANCPFHSEKTPSFIVSPDRQMWYCFGCGKGGDIFKFLMLYENLEFSEALKVLAEKAGIELRRISPAQQKEFGVLYDAIAAAKSFYVAQLANAAPVREYLATRGLTQETITEFELGWAPGGESLTLYLVNQGYDINDLKRAGLTVKTESGLHRDRFQQRVVFPIFNNLGKAVGFTGRILPVHDGGNMPKYLNSPETLIFNKSRLLYGFHKSKSEIGRSRSVFLVEGQMDFLMVWQSGIKNVVAVSGTALGANHLTALQRVADTLIVSFDQDNAGLMALERVLDLTNNFDFTVKALDLGSFKDPADAALLDPAALRASFADARPAFARIIDYHLGKLGSDADIALKKRTIKLLLAKIKNVTSSIEQHHWLKELASRSGIDESALFRELQSTVPTRVYGNQTAAASSEREVFESKDRYSLIAERLLSIGFANDKLLPALHEHKAYFPPHLQTFFTESAAALASDLGARLSLRSSYEFSELDATELAKVFNDLLTNLKLEYLKKKSQELQQAIVKAEKAHDDAALLLSSKELHATQQELNALRMK